MRGRDTSCSKYHAHPRAILESRPATSRNEETICEKACAQGVLEQSVIELMSAAVPQNDVSLVRVNARAPARKLGVGNLDQAVRKDASDTKVSVARKNQGSAG